VASRLRALSAHDATLMPIVEMLESAEAQAGEAARALRHYAERVDLDPQALREVEARIEALHAAARKHRVRPEDLPARLADLEQQLKELELAANPEALRREVAAARKVFDGHAKKLSAKRKAAAEALGKAVTAAMQQFAMAGAKFAISLRELPEAGPSGAEQIEFEVASHPSLPLRPLARVASGGELSRVSLAIQLVAAKVSPVGVLVFDEVDTGIGGAVADVVGTRLQNLSRRYQVLCITHLPQIAAHATTHFSIVKSVQKGRTVTRVERLSADARRDELARMIGGADVSAAVRASAREMLASRTQTRAKGE
jgi:DNA repair protein RecN (Recombination protein N)